MKKLLVILFLIIAILYTYGAQVQIVVSGTVVNPEPLINITQTTWSLGSLKVGDVINSSMTPAITFKAPTQSIVDAGTGVTLKISASKTNWRGVDKLTMEESTLIGTAVSVPLGSSYTLLTRIYPTLSGVTYNPKFTLTGTANSVGTIVETITITATYV